MIDTILKDWITATFAASGGITIYPIFAPANAVAPYALYVRTGATRQYTLDGQVAPITATYRMTFWGQTYDEAVGMGNSLVSSVARVVAGLIPGPSTVQELFVDSDGDAFEPSRELLERGYFGRGVDLRVVYNE